MSYRSWLSLRIYSAFYHLQYGYMQGELQTEAMVRWYNLTLWPVAYWDKLFYIQYLNTQSVHRTEKPLEWFSFLLVTQLPKNTDFLKFLRILQTVLGEFRDLSSSTQYHCSLQDHVAGRQNEKQL